MLDFTIYLRIETNMLDFTIYLKIETNKIEG